MAIRTLTSEEQEALFRPIPSEMFDQLTREELVILARGEQSIRIQLERRVKELEALAEEMKQRSFSLDDQLVVMKNKLYGKSSERSALPEAEGGGAKSRAKTRVQLPSERYPDATLIEREIELAELPSCSCCGEKMKDSGMTEDSEFLQVIPAQYLVIHQKRHKYSCGKCHGDVKTAPAPPRIAPGSSYSDDMAIDVASAKYCDLIPVERYCQMAKRQGLKDLPPQSLIGLTHQLAEFARPAYERIREEILAAEVLHADETPHRMLEGSARHGWYLWGFSAPKASYFEIRDTRSGEVASRLLAEAVCSHLVTDVYSGYGKAVREANAARALAGKAPVVSAYCNAHARRKFKDAEDRFGQEAKGFVEIYSKIYRLEGEAKGQGEAVILEARRQMAPLFREMRSMAMSMAAGYSSKSSIGKAISYFLENYDGLSVFLGNAKVAIDNNSQERLLRSPVIGRKTWYGTHSIRGAETAAILFTLVQSAKLCGVNPRDYLKRLVGELHRGRPPFTPAEYENLPPDPPPNAG